MRILPFGNLPHYKSDYDLPSSTSGPDGVNRFREGLAQADALILTRHRYNYLFSAFTDPTANNLIKKKLEALKQLCLNN